MAAKKTKTQMNSDSGKYTVLGYALLAAGIIAAIMIVEQTKEKTKSK